MGVGVSGEEVDCGLRRVTTFAGGGGGGQIVYLLLSSRSFGAIADSVELAEASPSGTESTIPGLQNKNLGRNVAYPAPLPMPLPAENTSSFLLLGIGRRSRSWLRLTSLKYADDDDAVESAWKEAEEEAPKEAKQLFFLLLLLFPFGLWRPAVVVWSCTPARSVKRGRSVYLIGRGTRGYAGEERGSVP